MKKIESIAMLKIQEITSILCNEMSMNQVLHKKHCNSPMPSPEKLGEFIDRLKSVVFPGYFGPSRVYLESLPYHVSANLDSIYRLLLEQIHRGACFSNVEDSHDYEKCGKMSTELAMKFMAQIPNIRQLLISDARAAYEGDPAAQSPGEAIFCYPSMLAMTHHRIAHELYKLGVPIIPRMISEMAHSRTGIDIHPGASIGKSFFIDHGTGVVIGETCIIGSGCRLYQGVTLGALSFNKADDGTLVKGIARHQILHNNVTVYAGASILGRITIGEGAIIGGNVWLTKDVLAGGKIIKNKGTKAADNETLKASPD